MLKKYLAAGLVAGMLALGAASATSLDLSGSPTLATSTVELTNCTADAVAFTVLEQLQPTQPQGAFVDTIEVTGFAPECIGKKATWRLLGDDGKTAPSVQGTAARAFDIEITGPDMSFAVYNASWVLAEDVYGVRIIVTD